MLNFKDGGADESATRSVRFILLLFPLCLFVKQSSFVYLRIQRHDIKPFSGFAIKIEFIKVKNKLYVRAKLRSASSDQPDDPLFASLN